MTHDELIQRSERWLRNTMRCRPVLSEAYTANERADAIGWCGGISHLVECKVSIGDFYADRRKTPRFGKGLGHFRWFLTPPGLLRGRTLLPLWGLLEAHPKQVRRVCRARQVPISWWNWKAEFNLLAKWAEMGMCNGRGNAP